MSKQNDVALVEETKALIAEVESGTTARAAWVAIRDRVERLCGDRTQPETAQLLGKSRAWVADVLAWDVEVPDSTPFNAAGERPRALDRNERGAKKVLRDPEQRRKVIESLSEEERVEIAKAAMEPVRRDEERGHKERRAHRESKPARERGVVELLSAKLDVADLNILSAIHTANETTWDDEEVNAMADGRIDRTAMRLDLLRMAVKSEGDIDAELAKIEEAS